MPALVVIEPPENARVSSSSEIVSWEECSRAAPEGAPIFMAADPARRGPYGPRLCWANLIASAEADALVHQSYREFRVHGMGLAGKRCKSVADCPTHGRNT